ncbi:MAG: SpoVT / AbrB like domain protein [Candidatus Methanofastidiosum methylothiophilum]|uniref:SpoVT / AbrB like domain protein n=1 Tax=Candidatus Methanofastidiosum methylothiophilum TaxID=1705564 RepID=A0A150IPF5_9EURY|nr:MAG: SpoVT / AbrB like domain protein [Candidatus Methanofastidiosum methylthiophilus]KYC46732.1 MAG: SpoVT / AbrB like domain protein [Candidatus Methanofastidiosum methylthiophilus]KYC51039.1 MAG: SpoVT / AbrB like domain protein [Candidatus Methanofastidiosum methylthiophilus]
MEVDVTHISKNGQVVIPVKIRKAANIKPNNEFYVYNVGEKILLEPINKENIKRELGLLELIKDAEKQIEKGESVTFESSTSLEEMDKKLMEKVYED